MHVCLQSPHRYPHCHIGARCHRALREAKAIIRGYSLCFYILMKGKAKSGTKPWGGRFGEETDSAVEAFTASVHLDRRLYRQDIRGSLAHAEMLHRVGLLSTEEHQQIQSGLQQIREEIESGSFTWRPELEDVHMNIESALVERIGETGKKLHTARSRNDQVAVDMRLYLREASDEISGLVREVQEVLLNLAEQEAETVMPGYTHLQVAQPISFGHHMLAWNAMLERDRERLADCRKRINVSPLGAAALAGSSHPVDPAFTAELLGFERAFENSLDAVSDRDFAVEFVATAALLMVHLSRMGEELVLWCSPRFGFVELPDRFCTGSSIMPQKKNPDVPELIRGKAGRVLGDLVALLTLLKGQPLAYNRDNQEDKEPLFDSVDTLRGCLGVLRGLLGALQINRDAMREAVEQGYATATELADYLVTKGVPFRDAHEITGQAVAKAIAEGKQLPELSLEELQIFSAEIDEDVLKLLHPEGAMHRHAHPGGPAPEAVRKAVLQAREKIGRQK